VNDVLLTLILILTTRLPSEDANPNAKDDDSNSDEDEDSSSEDGGSGTAVTSSGELNYRACM